MQRLTVKNKNFYKGGKQHYVYSGAIHYFRLLPSCWRDRMEKLKNCGFNTVETYTCWSLHERKENQFDFSGRLDLGKFIDMAGELGLDVIIRPGPYICAETDFGGMPSWLLNYPGIGLRSFDPIFLEKTERYFKELSKIIKPRLAANGGPVQMIQIENEYGSYGNDNKYKEALLKIWKKLGVESLFFTADGSDLDMQQNGGIDGVMHSMTFGSRPGACFEGLKRYGENQPLFCVEYWDGWFNTYGSDAALCEVEKIRAETAEFLSLGASFNYYMFCGGTNYGMINGANYYDDYAFQTTSYDYCAPINESGDLTEKYYAIKSEIEKHSGKRIEISVKNSEKKAYPSPEIRGFLPIEEVLKKIKKQVSPYPLSFEKLGVDFGYVYYKTKFDVWVDGKLTLFGLRDRATVILNGEIRGVIGQDSDCREICITVEKDGGRAELGLLVENRGRCNYGPHLKDGKGLIGALFRDKYLLNYENYPLTAGLPDDAEYRLTEEFGGAGFYKFGLKINEEPCDTFLYPSGFRNGCVYINGVNIGRFCNTQPPQRTLYVSADLLKKGENEIIVFDTDGTENPAAEFFDKPFYAGSGEKRR